MSFEWDINKNKQNIKIHDVSFEEAIEAFYDPNAVQEFDLDHSTKETRFYLIGFSSRRYYLLFTPKKTRTKLFESFPREKPRQNIRKNMKPKIMEKNEIQPFRFGVVEEKDEEIIIEVNQKDYEQDLAVGIPEDELLKPGKHKFRRRMKIATREDLHPSSTKVEFQMKLDLDVFNYFQSRAENEEIKTLQLLLNEKLRAVMEDELKFEQVERKLLNDKNFIAALAEEIKKAA